MGDALTGIKTNHAGHAVNTSTLAQWENCAVQ